MSSEHMREHDAAESHKLELEKLDFERIKLQAESTRHITTLAIGIIVLITTFMDKLPKPLLRTDLLREELKPRSGDCEKSSDPTRPSGKTWFRRDRSVDGSTPWKKNSYMHRAH